MAILITPSTPLVITPSGPPITIRPGTVLRVGPANSVLIRPAAISAIRVAPSRPTTVRPPNRGAWDERGWSRSADHRREVYEGTYQVGTRRFRGRVEQDVRGRQIVAYIHNPPAEIKRHRHGACFQQNGIGTGWFRLHWRRSPRNVDEAILYMEQVLDESLNR